jgi:hypothetical protein
MLVHIYFDGGIEVEPRQLFRIPHVRNMTGEDDDDFARKQVNVRNEMQKLFNGFAYGNR